MNLKDKNPDYRMMYAFVKKQFENSVHFAHGPFDETYFTLRVYESAKKIMGRLDISVNKELVLTAAILHDIGKIKLDCLKIWDNERIFKDSSDEWHRHAELGLPIVRKILSKWGHSKVFIEQVCDLVKNHDARDKTTESKSIELQVLQDADLLADIGLAGFIRPFLYCGKFNSQSIIDSIDFVIKENRVSGKQLNLPVSRMIAKHQMDIQRQMAKEMLSDIDSDLL